MRLSPSDCDWSISMNFAVPDRAMVPREETRSSRVMPMPVSSMTSVSSLAALDLHLHVAVVGHDVGGHGRDRLSSASDALTSRENTSLLLYRELTMRSRRRSAWYSPSPAPLLAGFPRWQPRRGRQPPRDAWGERRRLEVLNGLRTSAAWAAARARANAAREVIAAADIVVVADGWIVSSGGYVGREGEACFTRRDRRMPTPRKRAAAEIRKRPTSKDVEDR